MTNISEMSLWWDYPDKPPAGGLTAEVRAMLADLDDHGLTLRDVHEHVPLLSRLKVHAPTCFAIVRVAAPDALVLRLFDSFSEATEYLDYSLNMDEYQGN